MRVVVGIKPPPTPVLAIFFTPGVVLCPLLGVWVYPLIGVVLSPQRGGIIPAKGWFYPPIGSLGGGGVLPLWGGFVPAFR